MTSLFTINRSFVRSSTHAPASWSDWLKEEGESEQGPPEQRESSTHSPESQREVTPPSPNVSKPVIGSFSHSVNYLARPSFYLESCLETPFDMEGFVWFLIVLIYCFLICLDSDIFG